MFYEKVFLYFFNFQFFTLTLLLWFNVSPTQQASVQLHIFEDKISLRNDTDYVRRIMQNAKTAEIRSYMHPEADTCDNFFEFACGNWAKINPANEVQPRETNFHDLLSRTYQRRLMRVLQANIEESDNDAEVKVKRFYASCMHLAETPQQLKYYKYQLREIINEFGHMPALLPDGAWREDDFDWLATIAKIQNTYSIDIILQIGIRADFDNRTMNRVFVGEPSLQLGTKSMYVGEATKWHRDNYKAEIQRQLEMHLGMAKERANVTALEILNFEIELARGLFNENVAKTLKSLSKLRTMEELSTTYGSILDISKYLRIALGGNFNASAYEYMMEYQENLVRVLKKTPKYQIANYIYYQLIEKFLFLKVRTKLAQEKFCFDKTKLFFTKILDNIVYRKYISGSNEMEVLKLWNYLKQTFKDEFESEKFNWMSVMARKLAVEKLETMKFDINSYVSADFSEEYSKIDMHENDFLGNFKQLMRQRAEQAIATINEIPKPTEEPLSFSYTPVYVATENIIKIPVAILQPNFLWSIHYPKAVEFGTLGYLMAHELVHGFDDMGCNFDMNGEERHWWDANTTLAFNERKKCFKQQYSNYLYGGKYLPENDLQSENIADNGGIQLAYTAYQKYLNSLTAKDVNQMESLAHFNYTNRQLFFISFAQFWCNDVDEHVKDKVSLADIHAPAMYRVIGSLSNFHEFAKEFSCATGTRMNPEKKCSIY